MSADGLQLFAPSETRRLARRVGRAFQEKYRSGGVVSGEALVGDVAGSVAIVLDDLISSGGTIARAVAACAQRGAKAVYAAASHGMFSTGAGRLIADAGLKGLVITDTVPPLRLDSALVRERIATLSVAPLFAEAVRRMHEGGSVVDLLDV